MSLKAFVAELSGPTPPLRVHKPAIYFATREEVVPWALSLHLRHNGVVHEPLVLLKIITAPMPRVGEASRMRVKDLAPGIKQVEVVFGFAEKPDILATLTAHADTLGEDVSRASFFLDREVPIHRCVRTCLHGRRGFTRS